VITDEIDPDLGRALAVSEELGISAVELRSVDGTNVVELDNGALRAIRAELDERGFDVCAIASPFLKCHRGVQGPEQEQVLARAIDVAVMMSAPIVRAFSYWREPNSATACADLSVELRHAAVRAKNAGVRLALENEHECNVASSSEARALLDAAHSPHLRLIWDAGNAAKLDVADFDGLGGLETIYESVVHVHLKDVDESGEWVRIGDGVVDHSALLSYLQRVGYRGFLSVEAHYESAGSREQATRECVGALRSIAKRARVQLAG
jgi:sugar phosphate isomerase/epimerase